MKIMNEKIFNVIIEQDEDGIYVARVPEISGCYTQAKNVDELMKRIREAIEVCLEAEEENINPLKFVGLQRIEIKND